MRTVGLTELNLRHLHFAGWLKPQIDVPANAQPLRIAGRPFTRGVGTYATSTLWLELDGKVERFQALVGVEDSARDPHAAVGFSIIGDDRKLWESGVRRRGASAVEVDLALNGVRSLLLKVDHAEESTLTNYAVWAEARFIFSETAPVTIPAPREAAVILTPKPLPSPRINGPKVYGCRPGHPFLFRIPATGERPMQFSAPDLPTGLQLDAETGIITGTAPARGTYAVTLQARNRHGENARAFKIVSGDTLALTPHMGWNDWYAHYHHITDQMMREAADLMIQNGMADVGYEYVNIDDCWMNGVTKKLPGRDGPARDAQGNLQPNSFFPDMKALTDHIHAQGLKAGIYSSPGPATCGGYEGSYQHEEQDARQFAAWGFDFLKYDMCSYRQLIAGDKSVATLQRPYRMMGDLLKRQPRDIVFNLCQYGLGEVWKWGAEVGGQSWRTADDLGAELNRVFDVALKNAEYRAWSKPGSWNDPDYIQIGYIGSAHFKDEPQPCALTPTEQYAFMSLWCLMAAPLIYSGDLTRLDEFTLNVLCNPEVIAINQDPLGECARVVPLTAETFLMIKQLDEGSHALGLCNRGEISAEVTATWTELGLADSQHLRDLWRHRDLGEFANSYTAKVPRHGVALMKIKAAGR